jgi:hypothetical protein
MSHQVSKSHLWFRAKPDHDDMIDASDRQHVGHEMVGQEHSDQAWGGTGQKEPHEEVRRKRKFWQVDDRHSHAW